MRKRFTLDEFAELSGRATDELEIIRQHGLLDLDQDGHFDEFDALRLGIVTALVGEGRSLEEISLGVRDGSIPVPFVGEVLFRTDSPLTIEEVSARAGFTVEQIETLATSVGLSRESHLTTGDAEGLGAARLALDAGMPWEAVVEMGRVWGDAFRRIAQAEVRMVHNYLHEPMMTSGADESEIMRQTGAVLEVMQPVLQPLHDYFHRQHLAKEAAKDALDLLQFKDRPPRGGGFDATLVFVDLSSFTMLAQVRGDQIAADVLDRFDAMVRSVVKDHEGMLAKQIGDAFMLVSEDPSDGVRFSLELARAAGREEELPEMRIGIHHGPVLYRVGDYVGNTVNLASRLAAEAMPGEILVTPSVAEGARRIGIQVVEAGMRMLRGSSEPLVVYRVVREPQAPIDPVCGSIVEEAAARIVRDGSEIFFDTEDCLRKFLEEPERYLELPL